MTREDFLDYIAAFNRDDPDGYAKYYADDVSISYQGGKRTLSGPQAIIDNYKDIHAKVRQRLEPVFLVVDDTGVAGEMHSSFTALEDVPDFMVHPLKKGQTVKIHTFVHYDLNAEGKFKAIRSVRHGTLEVPE